ncbi:hypothetical protein M438DRAFT_360538 [Aureobasidium pullulans EXF-150]|uniref:Uncharacterized protein n=1 Tax=Aureobasidium pullulans EXF-150 TaxID=1043002 RepID=A0A074X3P4_AURPU|nr:uncharacterized protein M438DRAFT_360538 [Aureobasidium pullulans EXF-150]KEQ78404.1 hypothetical protein M438DRAFT_360538 [Aureobasidium pullulans EXF-150]
MDLPIKSSISQIGETQWLIGHDHICELQDFSSLKDNILYRRRDPFGRTFQVRCTSSIPATILISVQPFYSAGASTAVWEFAGLIWKVRSWAPDIEDEAQTISFVKDTFPTISVPEIICHWTEVSGKRYFRTMKRAPGETSDDPWGKLPDSEHKTVASDITDYTLLMADVRRDALENVARIGVTNASIQPDSWHLPTFRLRIDEATRYFQPFKMIFPKWWINYKARVHAVQRMGLEEEVATSIRDRRMAVLEESQSYFGVIAKSSVGQ